MLISLLSFVVCLVMLASCCYAWFTAVLQGPKSNIKAGTFGVEAVVSQRDVVGDGATLKEAEAIGNESISIEVPNGNTYQVSLTAIGEASKGYCVVTVNDTNGETVYHTGPILMTEEPLEFTLVSTGIGTTEITIQPSWGEYQEDSGVGSILIEETITVSGEVEEPVENIAETAPEETTTVAETTEEATTEAVETTAETTTEAVETTAAESSAEAETTVNATVEATTEAVETAADTNEADTTEAVETVETSAEETTAEATTESLSAEE